MTQQFQKYHPAIRIRTTLLCLLWSLLAFPPLILAQQPSAASASFNGDTREINVPIYKSRIINLDSPVAKVSVGNPEVADLLIMRAQQLYLLGKGLGTTNVLLWDKNNRLVSSLDVEVTHDLNSLKAKLHRLLPGEDIAVNSSQGAIVLSGEVSSLTALDTALQLATSFAQQAKRVEKEQTGEVINLLSVGGGQQVMLKVTVAEMNRDVLKRLGIKFNAFGPSGNWQFGAVNGGATFPDAIFGTDGLRTPVFMDGAIAGPMVDEFAPSGMGITDKGLFGSFLSNDFLFNVAIDAAKNNGTASILAEPTLTTLSGQEAQFLSGGEFPIPVPGDDGTTTIEFKEFGVGLKFVPVVLDSGRINLKVNISVSELVSASGLNLSPNNSNGVFVVPALTKRSAHTTVELASGQSIGIAGLINENSRDLVEKFPGLGDLPILGHLFRSQEYKKNTTELVILVTPELAKPVARTELSLPTDNHLEPSDMEFYLLGKNHGKARTAEQAQVITPAGTKGGSESRFGHSIQ
ncbi:type II and III secretion system protein family protein [Motiliproteus sp. SC1-56]|uniref:type II and III secretion system protein family protein n=1 Tax=Motiliproteus sp. SC1-56 TaxID=2799565 RepID=UPI001A8F2BFD|nr:type II and III secretion system protein family protein [Motiliproteus sp. SC1-56]